MLHNDSTMTLMAIGVGIYLSVSQSGGHERGFRLFEGGGAMAVSALV